MVGKPLQDAVMSGSASDASSEVASMPVFAGGAAGAPPLSQGPALSQGAFGPLPSSFNPLMHSADLSLPDRLTGSDLGREPLDAPIPSSGVPQLRAWDGLPQGNNSSLAMLPGSQPLTDPSILPSALMQLQTSQPDPTRTLGLGRAVSGFLHTNFSQPVERAVAAVSEGGRSALQAPVSLAMAGARMGSGIVMGAAEGAADGAKRAWRRKNQSEESKEKERARNRRAQRRFRERQKERLAARKDSMKELAKTLQAVSEEKDKIEQRNAVLEKMATMQFTADASARSDGADGADSSTSAIEFSDMFSGEDAPKSIRVTLTTGPLELSQQDLKRLSWEQHVHIWRDQVEQLAEQLALPECADGNASERLLTIIGEACGMAQCLCALNPMAMLRLQSHRLDRPLEAPEDSAPAVFWDGVLNQIAPSEAVMADALQLRREHLAKLGVVLKKRMDVNQVTLKTLGRSSLQGSASTHASKLLVALEASKKLQASLREEQSLLVQRMAMTQQKLLSPHQCARQLVASWPWYPDTIALVESAARRFPSEPKAEDLLGLQLSTSSKSLLKNHLARDSGAPGGL